MSLAQLDAHRYTATTPSGPISYIDRGQGPVALFVHGVGTNAYLWRHVVAGVEDIRRCVSLDLPLHGHSPAQPDQDFSAAAMAELLEQFCETLGLDTVDLVGNDTGGAICQVFAARHPERIRTLTLTNCDTRDNFPPAGFQSVIDMAAAGQLAPLGPPLVENPELARSGPFGDGFEHPEKVSDEVLLAYIGPTMGTIEAGQQFERWLTGLDNADLVAVEPQLKELAAPTLVVWGTGDEFFGLSYAHWLRDTIPGVTEVVEVPGGKLFFPEERPDELIAPLRRFWQH